MTLAILLVVISVLIFCSALFSGVETALFSLKPHQLRRLETNHVSLTKFVKLFRENPRRVLNVLLLGDGVINVLLWSYCASFSCGRVHWLSGFRSGLLVLRSSQLLCCFAIWFQSFSRFRSPIDSQRSAPSLCRYRCRFLTASAAVSRA